MDNRLSTPTIGQLLKQARLNAGLTQVDAAKLAGFHNQTSISAIEQGTDAKVSTLIRLAKIYGTTASEIIQTVK